jgi:flagellar basal body rod protein FlgB
MALTSTLFTGLSGLDAAQTWMNVIGNNIANVNTVAFKASQVTFTPQFYVTQQAASAPNGTSGGTNPSQPASASKPGPSPRISPPAQSTPQASIPIWPSTAPVSSSSIPPQDNNSHATARSR